MYAWIKTCEKCGFLGLSPADRRRHDDHHKHTLGILTLEAGIETSVSSVGDSYDNAMAESIIGLFKTEVIKYKAPWKTAQQLE